MFHSSVSDSATRGVGETTEDSSDLLVFPSYFGDYAGTCEMQVPPQPSVETQSEVRRLTELCAWCGRLILLAACSDAMEGYKVQRECVLAYVKLGCLALCRLSRSSALKSESTCV
jgi:hypothetical protein